MCLAVYERRKEKRAEKDRNSFVCVCGHVLARWNGFVVPSFTKIKDSSLSKLP